MPLMLVTACADWEPALTEPSPDGIAVAEAEVKRHGASGANRTRVLIENLASGRLLQPGEILSAEGAIVGETRLRWAGPDDLVITVCEASEYEVRSVLMRDPVFLPDGSPNVIRVDVENLRYSERDRNCSAAS